MRIRTIPPVLVAVLAVGACATDGGATRPHIDAESYVDDYTEGQLEMTSAAPSGDSAADASSVGPPGGAVPATSVPVEPGPFDDNVFVDAGDSTFVATDDDAESTFGLDVDTGSFTVGRAFLDEGALPDPASIRVEEWINAFDYGDPAPTVGELGVTVETGDAPHAADGTRLVRVGVSTADVADDERPPANITFVIDTSGSMDIRERLGLVQASLALLVQSLRGDDSIAIVTYGNEARPLLAPTPVSSAERIIAAIDQLAPGGSTNMEAGLVLGYQQARAAAEPGELDVVVLASDGVANVGITDPTILTDQITQAGEDGIHLVTVGFGMGNYNDQLMEQLADRGDGFYAYVDTFEEARRLFGEDLTATLTVVAGDAKAQVVFDPEVVESYRLVGYENRMLDDEEFRDDTVDAGELGAGHAVSALYEVRRRSGDVQPLSAPTVAPQGRALGEVRLRWTTPAGEVRELVEPIADGSSDAGPFRLAAAVADVAEVLKGNDDVIGRGITLDDVAADVSSLVEADVPGAAELAAVIADARSIQG
ncbi:MAG: von Willebrand factor type A domain-containing protein [Ilumatobacteraceae bacterium]